LRDGEVAMRRLVVWWGLAWVVGCDSAGPGLTEAVDAGASRDHGGLDGGIDVGRAPDGGRDAASPDGAPPDPLDATPADVGAADALPPDAALPDAALPTCDELDLPLGSWRNPFDSPQTASAGDPHHSAVEPTVNPGRGFRFDGKFAYGTFSEDLEGETVEVWLRPRTPTCGAWALFGSAVTDGDGRVGVEHPGFMEVGQWDFRMRVPGDNSRAVGRVRVVPRGRQAVVFDVDGTLTIGDREIFEEVLLGRDPEMYVGGPAVVQRWYDQGYLVVYMTGRPYFLNPSTRAWLERHGFPEGPVRTTDSISQTLPTEDGVQTYKLNWINHLRDKAGLDFEAAYGNATTDICAYALANISTDATWIIGPHAGERCDGFAAPHALVDYPGHLPELDDLPPANP
jgi:hypothetical protein